MDRCFVDKMAAAFQDELEKIAQEKRAADTKSLLVPGIAVGALGTMALQRAHRDWRMGRAVRLQNQAQGY